MQLDFESAGYKLLGFAPGCDREVVSPGVVKRVFEAYYAKILVPIGELHVPDKKNLTPQTLTLFKTLKRRESLRLNSLKYKFFQINWH